VASYFEDLDVGRRIILKLSLEKYIAAVWKGLIWLRIGTSRELF
jgi:hypothetical protein